MTNSSKSVSLTPQINPLGERAVLVEFGRSIDPQLAEIVQQLERKLLDQPFPGFSSTVLCYTGLCVHYNPTHWATQLRQQKHSANRPGKSIQHHVIDYLTDLCHTLTPEPAKAKDIVRIPVCYGGEYGPDLEEVARHSGSSANEVIERHTAGSYLVYMMGFMPGFAYLGGLDHRLATPRKGTPRQAVPAGAVGIAGTQTGIYPLESPGGWQLIGRTPLTLFDPNRDQPILLRSGVEVKFERIDADQFLRYTR